MAVPSVAYIQYHTVLQCCRYICLSFMFIDEENSRRDLNCSGVSYFVGGRACAISGRVHTVGGLVGKGMYVR